MQLRRVGVSVITKCRTCCMARNALSSDAKTNARQEQTMADGSQSRRVGNPFDKRSNIALGNIVVGVRVGKDT
jgi:hypothetical protein